MSDYLTENFLAKENKMKMRNTDLHLFHFIFPELLGPRFEIKLGFGVRFSVRI